MLKKGNLKVKGMNKRSNIKQKPIKLKPKTIKRRKTRVKKKKQTKADFLRSWGLLPTQWMRYSGLKGIYWAYFSRWIRQRDYDLYKGLCMTCNKYVEKGNDQAGHLFSARSCGFFLLFHPLNVHIQHSKCNNPRFTPDAGVRNAININERYGGNLIQKLSEWRNKKTKEWSKERYIEEIKKLPNYNQNNA